MCVRSVTPPARRPTSPGGRRSMDELEPHHLDLAVLVRPQERDLSADAEVAAGAACDAGSERLVGVPDHAVEFDVSAWQPERALAGDGAVVAGGHDQLDG